LGPILGKYVETETKLEQESKTKSPHLDLLLELVRKAL
jgi:hypothetical protein